MPYISSIKIDEYRHLRDIVIDCGQDGRHLILTGPNGSGKTSILEAIRGELDKWLESITDAPKGYTISFTGSPNTPFWQRSQSILAYFGAFREGNFQQPSGPKDTTFRIKQLNTREHVSDQLLQIFVNQKTQQAYATVDGDQKSISEIEQWFERMRSALSVIFEDDDLELVFERDRFLYRIRMGDERIVDFNTLADGHKAALMIVSELLLRKEAIIKESGAVEPDGIVLIDEIETHLHLSLQEVILPFLCGLFPQIQFIVATHSPAVIASVDDATIFDLRLRRQLDSNELRGIRYGTLMTSHFGISSDFDLETTKKLEELKQLYNKERDENEEKRLRQLSEELSATSHALALEISLQLMSSQTPND